MFFYRMVIKTAVTPTVAQRTWDHVEWAAEVVQWALACLWDPCRPVRPKHCHQM